MAKYKIEFDADACIGTMQCLAEAEEIFKEDENGFTVLHKGTKNESTGKWELIIEDEGLFEKAKYAESECPVDAIKVTKLLP